MKNKIISLLLTAIMAVMLIPCTALARTYGGEFNSSTSDPNGNKYICTWIFDEASATLYIEGNGAIPEYNDSTNKPPWVEHRAKVENLVIEEGITAIGKRAFQKHSKLKNISFPSTLGTIDQESFNRCTSLVSVIIPGNVNIIGAMAFYNCSGLETAVLEDGIDAINQQAFANCTNLKEVYVYSKTVTITKKQLSGDHGFIFKGCSFDKLKVYCYEDTVADTYFTSDIYEMTNADGVNYMTAGGYTLDVEYITE